MPTATASHPTEAVLATDPQTADTDGDGLNDLG